jgi:hypothetical protein
MESRKYIGMDVHQASISAAVRDDAGKLVMECVIETKAWVACDFFVVVTARFLCISPHGTGPNAESCTLTSLIIPVWSGPCNKSGKHSLRTIVQFPAP